MKITCDYCGTYFDKNKYLRCPTCDAPFGKSIECEEELREEETATYEDGECCADCDLVPNSDYDNNSWEIEDDGAQSVLSAGIAIIVVVVIAVLILSLLRVLNNIMAEGVDRVQTTLESITSIVYRGILVYGNKMQLLWKSI